MATKFLDSTGLKHLVDKLKETYAAIGHKHTTTDVTDFAEKLDAAFTAKVDKITDEEIDAMFASEAA